MKKNKETTPKIGDLVKVSPDLTQLKEWITGEIIKVRNNPFIGTEIAIKDSMGRIFFGEESYFKTLKEDNVCTQ